MLCLTFFEVCVFQNGDAICEAEGGLKALGETLLHAFADDDPVHDDVDVVLELLVERGRAFEVVELAIHLHALEAVLKELCELFLVLTLAATDHRREQVKTGLFRQVHRPVDHFRDGLALDGEARGRRIWNADARPEKTHIVVDLGDGADGRARILRRCLLLDGDGGREPFNALHIRLLHQLQELARIGRKALDIAPLALSIDRVEGKRGFARTGQPRQHDELVAGNVDIDILQIVFFRAAHADHAKIG